MVTIKDIAQMCNVSSATVSNVINGKTEKVSKETAELILAKIEEVGYKPNFNAKGLRTRKTRLIGIIAEDLSLFNVPPIINGITECCEEYGYMFFLENLRLYGRWGGAWFNDKEKYNLVFNPAMEEMSSINMDGMLYVAGHNRKISSIAQSESRPVVAAYSLTEDPKIPTFVLDDQKAAYDATMYLAGMGHKHIGIIGGERDNLHTLYRMEGYQKALFENKILYDPGIVCFGEWSRKSGYEHARHLVEQGVTAIFCYADYIAGGVYDYLEEVGLRAGQDISVMGFDNHEYASYMSPRLTTLRLPLHEIGYQSAKRLIEMIEGTEPENAQMVNRLECELIERKSCVVI